MPEAMIDWDSVLRTVTVKERIPKSGRSPSSAELGAAVRDCVRLARHLVACGTLARTFDVGGISEASIALKGPPPLYGPALAGSLRGSNAIVLFLVTIGSELESAATMLMNKGEELHGYLLDRIGSFAVESMAEDLEKRLRLGETSMGRSVSMRYSPGYCDTPIEEQAKLDKAIGFANIGVRLTESYVMVPQKSISGIIGIGPKGLFSDTRSPCEICNLKECDYKRVAADSRERPD